MQYRAPAAQRDAARRQDDAVADCCDRLAGVEEIRDGALQDSAFQILAHALGMPARQQQRAEIGVLDLRVIQRLAKCRIVHKFAKRRARVVVRTQRQADEFEIPQCRNAAPEIQTNAGQHDRIGMGRPAVRRCEDDVMTGVGENPPADRRLGWIKVRARQRHQYLHAGGGPSRNLRCAQATSCHAPNL